MKADKKKIIDLIKQDKEAMHHIIIVAMFLASLNEENKTDNLTYEEYDFFDFWASTLEDKEKQKALLEKKDEVLAMSIEAYKPFYEKKDEILDYHDIEDDIAFYLYMMTYGEYMNLCIMITRMLYFANKYKGSNFEKRVKEYLLTYINVEELKQELPSNKKKRTLEELELENNYLKKKHAYYILSQFFHKFYENGEYSYYTIIEMLEKKYYFFKKWGLTYKDLKEIVAEDVSKTFTIEGTIEEYIARRFKDFAERSVKDAKAYFELRVDFLKELKRIGEEEGVDTDIVGNDIDEKTREKVFDITKKINDYTLEDANKKGTLADVFDILSYDKELKDYLIDNTIEDYALSEELKEERQGRYKRYQTRSLEDELKPSISSVRDHTLTEELKNTKDEWLKASNSKTSQGIFDARGEIATYKEADFERYERELKEKKEAYKKQPSEELKEEIEDLEAEYKESKKNYDELCERIETEKKEYSDLLRLYNEAEDEDTKKEYLKLMKKKDKDIKADEEKRDKRGLFTQLDLFSNDLKIDNKDISLRIPFDNFDISKYSSEGQRLLLYIQDYVYRHPTEKVIPINLNDYAIQNGRKTSTTRAIRKKIEDTTEALFEERYKIPFTKEGNKITWEFRLISSKIDIEDANGKKSYAVRITDEYQELLLYDRNKQWASIPLKLNQLNGTPSNERAREIGLYLQQQLRNDLKNQQTGYDYIKHFKIKKFTELMQKKALNNNKGTYAKDYIEPLQDALNKLEDLGFIEYNTNAFKEYDGYTNTETGEIIKGTIGTNENNIKSTFESADIVITYKIADYETYDDIIEKRNTKKKNSRKKKGN